MVRAEREAKGRMSVLLVGYKLIIHKKSTKQSRHHRTAQRPTTHFNTYVRTRTPPSTRPPEGKKNHPPREKPQHPTKSLEYLKHLSTAFVACGPKREKRHEYGKRCDPRIMCMYSWMEKSTQLHRGKIGDARKRGVFTNHRILLLRE